MTESQRSREQLTELLSAPAYDPARKSTYVALDVPDMPSAMAMVDEFGDVIDGYKIGLQLFYRAGGSILDEMARRGKRVFLDVKLHDIPNTVAGAIGSVCQWPIEMVNVHALGGQRMMEAAREAVGRSNRPVLLIGVTILTSMDEASCRAIGLDGSPEELVMHLTGMALDAGLDGVVASAKELRTMKRVVPDHFERVIPGIRPQGSVQNDQARTASPGEAIRDGATRLVLGRALTGAQNRLHVLKSMWDEML